jgi:transcriptional regulator with XRE-family HTH domain
MEIQFSKRIRELRLERKLKQADVAKELKVTPATVTRWESQTQEPDYLTLALLAQFFEVTTDYLLGLDD